MNITKLGPDLSGSWTVSFQSTKFHEFVPGTLHSAFGIALLFYKPEKRLSVSIWSKAGAKNIRLHGPKKLSWENK